MKIAKKLSAVPAVPGNLPPDPFSRVPDSPLPRKFNLIAYASVILSVSALILSSAGADVAAAMAVGLSVVLGVAGFLLLRNAVALAAGNSAIGAPGAKNAGDF